MSEAVDRILIKLLWASRILVTAFLLVLTMLIVLMNRWERVTQEQVKLIEEIQKHQQKRIH